MIILDAATKSLELVLAGNVTTTALDWVTSFADFTVPTTNITAFLFGASDGTSNNTSAVTIVAAPASTHQRQVKFVSVQNLDTVAATVKIHYNDNGTRRLLYKATLSPNYTLTYTDGDGWRVWTTTGALLTAPETTLIYSATRILTNAEVIAWPNATYPIGPVPPSGYALKPMGLTWTKRAASGAWTGIDPVYATIQLQTATSGVWLSDLVANDNTLTTPLTRLTDFLGGANTRVAMIACPYNEPITIAASGDVGYNAPVVTASTSDHDGLGMELAMFNGGVNLGGGHVSDTLKATVYYAVEAL